MVLHDNNKQLLPLNEALQALVYHTKQALLLVAGYCIAMFCSASGNFGFFDSHSRNNLCLLSPNGTAVMFTFPSLNDLTFQVHMLCRSLGIQSTSTFELMCIDTRSLSSIPPAYNH